MAVVGKNGMGKFFIYDHNKLKKEEDDLKDAIVYFYPIITNADEQCALCGQLMGLSEFLQATISESVPTFFKLQNEKYCLKRVSSYTMGLEGSLNDSDFHMKKQLNFLHDSFVMFCGSIQNIVQQFENDNAGFADALQKIWDVLYPSGCFYNNFISQVFQIVPTVHLPKSGSDLFCQASYILQSSQRRPGVHVGAILYKNKVLCTQMPPELTRKLILVKPELPCIHLNTDFDISRSMRMITVYLTKDELKAIDKSFKPSDRHNHPSQFVWHDSMAHKTNVPKTKRAPSPYKVVMESIPEKETLDPYIHSVEQKDDRLSTNTIMWKTHDEQSESSDESRRLSVIGKEDIIETISDLEDGDHRSSHHNERIEKSNLEKPEHTVDILDGHIVMKSQGVHSDSSINKVTDNKIVVEATIHSIGVHENDDSGHLECNLNENGSYKKSAVHEEISEDNLEIDHNKTDNINRTLGSKKKASLDDQTHQNISKPRTLTDENDTLHNQGTSEEDTIEFSNNQDVKVDCLHECSCGCVTVQNNSDSHVNSVKSNTFTNTHNVPKRVNTHSEQDDDESKTSISRTENDNEQNINGNNMNYDEVFVDSEKTGDTVSYKYDPNLRIKKQHTKNENSSFSSRVSSDGEAGLSKSGFDDVSDDSGSKEETDGSFSDIASLSTSRRKERFDFQSSADESSSEYSLHLKRPSFDRKMKYLGDIDSMPNSLQSTLQNSGSSSMQSSITLRSQGLDDESDTNHLWTPQQDDLYQMTLYIQGQAANQSSETSMILLLDNDISRDKSVVHSLWKDALPQLADLDFYVQESVEQHLDEGFMETTSFLKYDTLSNRIEGNELDVPVNEDFQKLAGDVHKDYQGNVDLSSIALTSHLCSCNSSRDRTNELYYHVDGHTSNR
ncbi:HPS4 [Mytilus edulis]|uniref:HPS4 n=1 Tax=Mytilus edulis TaxID=6550 RepID=A0A8S3V038_MYTED|nr:HPS4 [Mytilus edulis]